MFIYKITNKANGKIYIGQVYNKTIQDRFHRHIKEASETHPMLIDRAIHKYGKDNFVIEQIDEATSLEELNQKEKYWIKFYNSTNKNVGYNLTEGGEGGNTYFNKTEKEMSEIKHKISVANSGKNNGHSRGVKAFNVKTKEILHFDTMQDVCDYFKYQRHTTFSDYCNNKAVCLFRKEWVFAYEENEFTTNLPEEYDNSMRKGTKVKLIDLTINEERIFNSLNKLNAFLNTRKGQLKFDNNECLYASYKIIKL